MYYYIDQNGNVREATNQEIDAFVELSYVIEDTNSYLNDFLLVIAITPTVVGVVDANYNSILHYLANEEHGSNINLFYQALLENGASPYIQNNEGFTAIDYNSTISEIMGSNKQQISGCMKHSNMNVDFSS